MKIVVTVLFMGMLLTGCMFKTQEQIIATPPQETKAESSPKQISRPFSEKILAGKLQTTDTNDGHRKVFVSVKNLTNESLIALYCFKWYCTNGLEVSASNQDMWNTIVIVAKDEIILSSSAPEKNCHDVKLLLKEAIRK